MRIRIKEGKREERGLSWRWKSTILLATGRQAEIDTSGDTSRCRGESIWIVFILSGEG